MSYRLGVDLGTTYTAAAVLAEEPSHGRPAMVSLGDRELVVPSVVLLGRGRQALVGEPAERGSVTAPGSTAREFKRRLGDSTPMILDGVPYSAHALMAKVFGWVLERVTERHGEPPVVVGVTHPANWGEYRRDVLAQAIRQVGVADPVLISEPEAAALSYAAGQRVRTGDVVGVYDLGGGTFDAAVLRRGPESFELLGSPAGVEQLGGMDFDAAVFAHVQRAVGEAAFDLDPGDPAVAAALHGLRRGCVQAKEALSYDTEAAVPVNLPGTHRLVRLTRDELEEMIRPLIGETIVAFRRALASSGLSPGDLSAVLLAGGSSRIPLVSQMLAADLGRPVTVDAHPKQIVALGAAMRLVPAAAPRRVEPGRVTALAPAPAPAADDPAATAVALPSTAPAHPSAAPALSSAAPAHPSAAPHPSGATGPTAFDAAAPGPSSPPTGPARVEQAAGPADPPGPARPTTASRSGVLLYAAAATGSLLVLLLSVFGLGGAATSQRLSDVPLAAGLLLPADVAVPQATLTVSVAGIAVVTQRMGAANEAVPLGVSQYLLAGPAVATVTPPGRTVRIDPRGGILAGGLLTVPGVAALAAVLFAVAYAEQFLRPLRRTGRAAPSALLGMGLVGGVLGLAAPVLGWALTDSHLLSIPLLLLCSISGLAAALAATVALTRRTAR